MGMAFTGSCRLLEYGPASPISYGRRRQASGHFVLSLDGLEAALEPLGVVGLVRAISTAWGTGDGFTGVRRFGERGLRGMGTGEPEELPAERIPGHWGGRRSGALDEATGESCSMGHVSLISEQSCPMLNAAA